MGSHTATPVSEDLRHLVADLVVRGWSVGSIACHLGWSRRRTALLIQTEEVRQLIVARRADAMEGLSRAQAAHDRGATSIPKPPPLRSSLPEPELPRNREGLPAGPLPTLRTKKRRRE